MPVWFNFKIIIPILIIIFIYLFWFDNQKQNYFEKIPFNVSGHLLALEVADTEFLRMQGLMSRKKLKKNSGMLFVFPAPGKFSMWMKDTYIPLSVAFIDVNGVILNIEKMEPLTEISHFSKGDAKYALEMNAGWFSSHGINPGYQFENHTDWHRFH